VRFSGPLKRHPARAALVGLALLALASFALYWFAPWNLFVDKRVNEGLPVVGGASLGDASDLTDAATGNAAAGAEPITTLARGAFMALEHETAGRVIVVELEDGTRFLRLEALETSNGPDLRVYLSSVPAQDDWYVYDDEDFVDLGGLKGNLGNSNYEIPNGIDVSDFESAVIWCRRFSVGFGVASLSPTT
jgi:Electron transfer DM13